MNRRNFVRSGILGGVALAGECVGASARKANVKHAAGPDSPAPPAFELDELTIAELQSGMSSGKYTAHSLARKYLDRIDDIDKRGPAINSIIELNPDALSIANDLDKERKAKGVRGPLHGIPVLIKDNIDTHDRMTTTAGSLALGGSIPLRDSTVARKLRDAGAIILGKTNLSEWANFRSSHSSSGWSGRGKQTKNPYVLDRNPCGSSSGTAAAIAANLGAIGVGTETDGSVVCPSNANSLVGIKPTLGLISRAGIVPIAHSQDTAGPMCRTVTDAVVLLGVLAGPDPGDIPTQGKFDDSELEVLLYEFKTDLNNYLTSLGPRAPVKTLKEIIDFNEQYRDREMPYFDQDLFIKAQAKGPLTDKSYRDALAKNHRMSRKEGIDFVMDKNKLDALLAPTGGPAWPTDWINGDHFA